MNWIFNSALLACAVGIATLVFVLVAHGVPPSPTLGVPGLRRYEAMVASSLFRSVEPLMRLVAGWFQDISAPKLRKNMNKVIADAGHPMGLTTDEFAALTLFCTVVGGIVGAVVAALYGYDPLFGVSGALIGGTLPYGVVTGQADRRGKQIYRELPAVIDLIALSMSAGLTFPNAMRQVISPDRKNRSPLDEELRIVLQETDLGHSRRHALTGLARRVPSEEVNEFVSAVTQSEEKGNPLAEVLTIQAGVLRSRRTMMGEEMASKAQVLMLMPLTMMMVGVLLMMGAPLFLKFMNEMG